MGTSVFPSTIHQASTVIANAAVLTLPTVPVSVLAAPGANRVILVDSCIAVCNSTAAAYTHIDGTVSVMQLIYDSSRDATLFMDENHGGPFFGGGDVRMVRLGPPAYADASGASTASTIYSIAGTLSTQFVNQGLSVSVFNGASGNFTGGNAANTLSIYIAYTIWNSATGLFE